MKIKKTDSCRLWTDSESWLESVMLHRYIHEYMNSASNTHTHKHTHAHTHSPLTKHRPNLLCLLIGWLPAVRSQVSKSHLTADSWHLNTHTHTHTQWWPYSSDDIISDILNFLSLSRWLVLPRGDWPGSWPITVSQSPSELLTGVLRLQRVALLNTFSLRGSCVLFPVGLRHWGLHSLTELFY